MGGITRSAKTMKKQTALSLASAILSLAMVCVMLAPKPARAQSQTIIQGQTPGGEFQSVGVSTNGFLFVVTSTGAAQSVSIIQSIPYQVYLATTPPSGGATLNPVTVISAPALTGTFTSQASTAATISTAQFSIDTSPEEICPVSMTRSRSRLCNADPSHIIYIGNSGVTITSGSPLFPNTCDTVDNPESFQGGVFAVSSATLAGTPASCLQITP
jgi:hypothetical protein